MHCVHAASKCTGGRPAGCGVGQAVQHPPHARTAAPHTTHLMALPPRCCCNRRCDPAPAPAPVPLAPAPAAAPEAGMDGNPHMPALRDPRTLAEPAARARDRHETLTPELAPPAPPFMPCACRTPVPPAPWLCRGWGCGACAGCDPRLAREADNGRWWYSSLPPPEDTPPVPVPLPPWSLWLSPLLAAPPALWSGGTVPRHSLLPSPCPPPPPPPPPPPCA